MMQNFLRNKIDLHQFLDDKDATQLNVRHTHLDAVSQRAQEYEVVYHKTAKGLTAAIREQTVNLDEPVLLSSVDIEKPWGREIWHTGVEERGECQIKTSATQSIPLSLYLSLAPQYISNNLLPLLLKVLDPLPGEPEGNLYFEVHEKKEEVYIVTHIDTNAWPNGKGAIRYGINPDKLKEYESDEQFRSAYLIAVKDYEDIRAKIDKGLKVDPAIETEARKKMNAFTATKEISLGDVIRVPTWVPHSLQHGVRVVEFQTPTYERFIISFEQKVVTQEHWDSEFAIQRMNLNLPKDSGPLMRKNGVERLADFDSFSAVKVDFDEVSHFDLSNTSDYAICLPIGMSCRVGTLIVPAETACLIPSRSLNHLKVQGTPGGYALIASPNILETP